MMRVLKDGVTEKNFIGLTETTSRFLGQLNLCRRRKLRGALQTPPQSSHALSFFFRNPKSQPPKPTTPAPIAVAISQ